MRTLRRYLAGEIYLATAFVLVAFLVLFAFFDLVSEMRDVGRNGYRLTEAFVFVLLNLPGHIQELFPIAALIGTLYVLARLASNSEFAVMRTAGLSPLQAGMTLARIGLVFVVLIILVGEGATPAASRAAQRLRRSPRRTATSRRPKSQLTLERGCAGLRPGRSTRARRAISRVFKKRLAGWRPPSPNMSPFPCWSRRTSRRLRLDCADPRSS